MIYKTMFNKEFVKSSSDINSDMHICNIPTYTFVKSMTVILYYTDSVVIYLFLF